MLGFFNGLNTLPRSKPPGDFLLKIILFKYKNMAEIIQLKKSFDVLRNGALSNQSPDVLYQHGFAISQMLRALGGDHTFHPTPEELQFAMQTNHAILATQVDGEDAGFVKAVPWLTTKNGPKMLANDDDIRLVDQGEAKPVCVEVGSLVVGLPHQGNNLGKFLAQHVVTHAQETYPSLPIIAVVTNDNLPSLAVFNKLGWKIVDKQLAIELLGIDVLDGWEPPSTIFLY